MAEPLFIQSIVGLVPLPTQIPPKPYAAEDLQRLFADVSQDANYQQFQFLPGGVGAQLFNSTDDLLMVQPGLLQVRRMIDSTPERARETTTAVLRHVEKRLQIRQYVQCGIKVIAHVPPPGMADAKEFVARQLMREGQAITEELGPTFFGSGVRFTSQDPPVVEVLNVEPLLRDNSLLFLDYDLQRGEQFEGLDRVAGWVDDAFDFIRGPAMRILEV